MATPQEIEHWLQQGVAAAKAGQLEQARFQLLDVVEQDQSNETAWYWLYQVFDRVDDQRTCLQNLILLNPKNMWAKQEFLNLLEATATPVTPPVHPIEAALPPLPPPLPVAVAQPKQAEKSKKKAARQKVERPVVLKLVTAFWIGISVILLGGGIISALEWVFNIPSANITFPLINLTLGVIFVISGVVGLMVALALLFQSMAGFYGSVFLAMGLLLVGPTFSLVTNPPNYLAMTCTGGISGMIVLLTLASYSGFKEISQNGNESGKAHPQT